MCSASIRYPYRGKTLLNIHRPKIQIAKMKLPHPASSKTFNRRILFTLFCLCIILVTLFTSILLDSRSFGTRVKLPSIRGIFERLPSWNNNSLTNLSRQSSPCPTCPSTKCETAPPCVCALPAGGQNCPTPPPCPPRYTDLLPFKRDLSMKLSEIHRDLKSSLDQNVKPPEHTLLKLEGILEELDRNFKYSRIIEVEKETYPIDLNDTLDVCPEQYLGEKKGYPFFQFGWVTQNCSNVKPLPQVLTILLNTVDYPEPYEDKIGLVLDGINKTYPGIQVYIAPKNTKIKDMAEQFPNVTAITVEERSTMGKIWNKLVAKVTTPYALVARDVVHFAWWVRVRRQIRMISEMNYVGVVGGSFRNWTGHWKIGCRQIKKKNYVLEYTEGYHYSSRSCMFCDDLEGPFVAKTKILKSAEFGEKLPKEVVFEDFFLRVLDMGYQTMNCPDTMYITNEQTAETKRRNREVWRFFSAKWEFIRILLPGGVKHAFSCQEISYKCRTSVTKYALMPYCCLEQYGRAMNFFQNFCVEHNILYELDAGSVLGAVKMSGYIPWDLDGDMSLLSQNMTNLRKFQDYFREKGFNLNGYSAPKWDANGQILKNRKGYLVFHSPDIYTEINGWPTLSGFLYLPPELRDPVYFTKVLINGYWINSMFSPGLYARNRYGLDVLKHSQSWLQVGGMGSSWSRYKPGRFLTCKYPKFHACLDKFPADGNIAFQVP